jgi:hypothetical protein
MTATDYVLLKLAFSAVIGCVAILFLIFYKDARPTNGETMSTRGLDEHGLRRKVIKKLNAMPLVVAKKIHGSARGGSGFPDLLVVFGAYRGADLVGRTMIVELKSPKGSGELTALQSHTIDKINETGNTVLVCTSLEEIVEAMEGAGYGREV